VNVGDERRQPRKFLLGFQHKRSSFGNGKLRASYSDIAIEELGGGSG